jgi:adenylate cyclase
MAIEMRNSMSTLGERWSRLGHELGFGVGIARGYVTLGAVGFQGRQDYAAIGATTNLAARLCDEARSGQILISRRVYAGLEASIEAEDLGRLSLKGFARPVPVYAVSGWRG